MGMNMTVPTREIEKALEGTSVSFHGVSTVTVSQRELDNEHGKWFCGEIVFSFHSKEQRDLRVTFHGDHKSGKVPVIVEDGPDNERIAKELVDSRHKMAIAMDILKAEI